MSYIKIPMGNRCSYINFTGTKEFSFKTPSLKWINCKKSYMGMRVRVTQTAPGLVNNNPVILHGLRPVTATNVLSRVDGVNHPCYVTMPYINNNPISCFYKNCVTQIGTEAIWNDEELMCGITMYKLHTMTKEEEKIRNSNNKISCISKNECFTFPDIPAVDILLTDVNITTTVQPVLTNMVAATAALSTAPLAASVPTYTYITRPSNISNVIDYFPDYNMTELCLSRRQEFLMKNNLFGFNQSHEILLTGAIPSPFFNSNDYIPPHTPITLRFTIDNNNYHTNLVSFSAATNATNNLSIIQMTSQDCQTTTNQIAVGVVDMFLYLYVENYDDVVNKSYDFEFLSYNGILKTMNQQVNSDSQLYNFPKQSKINFISCAFTQQEATIKNSLTDFGVRFDQVANVYFSNTVINDDPTTGVDYYDDVGNVITGQIGEIINYGAPPIMQTAEGYIKSTNNTTSPIINLRQISCMIMEEHFQVNHIILVSQQTVQQ